MHGENILKITEVNLNLDIVKSFACNWQCYLVAQPIIFRDAQTPIWHPTVAISKHPSNSKYYECLKLNSLSWADNSLSIQEKAGRSVYCDTWIDFKSVFCIHYHSNQGLLDWWWAVHYQKAFAGVGLSTVEGKQRAGNNLHESFDDRSYCMELEKPVVVKFKPPINDNDQELFCCMHEATPELWNVIRVD